jgi:hypothetical protein
MNTREDPRENPALADVLTRKAADTRFSLSRQQSAHEGGWGATSQIEKENAGKLRSYRDGARIRVTTQRFYEHLLELASAPRSKVREPVARFGQPKRKRHSSTRRRRAREEAPAITAAE